MSDDWTERQKFVQKAKYYAITCHRSTNHLYDNQDYSIHLNRVVDTAIRFIDLIPKDKWIVVFSAAWAHDTIEDTRQTYTDVKTELGEEVAEIVYALTNDKGKNRKERAGRKYYEGIRQTPFATFVKVCDRIANIEYSKQTSSSMFEKYQKENKEFVDELYTIENDKIFAYLMELTGELEKK